MLCVPAGAAIPSPTHHRAHHLKPLKLQVAKLLTDPAVSRSHWGIAVTKMDGTRIYALNAGQFFHPASNAKLFTTAAAVALLGPSATVTTRVTAMSPPNKDGVLATGGLRLMGAGDANLSGRTIPYVPSVLRPNPAPPEADPLRYLEEMADQVAKTGVNVVEGDVVGDDSLFPWQPYPEDWSIDDAVWGYGAPVSALTVNDNEMKVTITPAAEAGAPATVAIEQAVPYYTIESSVTTTAANTMPAVGIDRALGSKTVRVYGTVPAGMQPMSSHLAIDDPAEYAAMAFKQMLEQRGIRVTGKARAEHRLSVDTASFVAEAQQPLNIPLTAQNTQPACTNFCTTLAEHVSPSLIDDVVATNKVSQNLHAELLLRRLGKTFADDGSAVQGARVVRTFLTTMAGVNQDDFVFFDGSGLSGHDLVAPRATVKLLQYASTQPWFADWKASLPVGGVDGTLAGRFTKAPLRGHVFAKTGTLGEARALSGYIDCASGRTVIFSIMVDNHAPHSRADETALDRIVAAIAATN
jgi:D-alanyl-D-alanine carboxypeptidase/D-alanyl-D-alanine-endopeptidase (penicillin-binding protein 4)